MSLQNHAYYQLATKALLFKGSEILVLIRPDDYLDFPGGRIDETERDLAWTKSLQREVMEELGPSLKLHIGQTLFVSKRQYISHEKEYYIAAIFYKCEYLSGDITLSDEHARYEWLTPREIINHNLKFVSEDEKKQLLALFNVWGMASDS